MSYEALTKAILEARELQHRALIEHLDRVKRRWRIMFVSSAIIIGICIILAVNAFN
jgi:hypothetical protein